MKVHLTGLADPIVARTDIIVSAAGDRDPSRIPVLQRKRPLKERRSLSSGASGWNENSLAIPTLRNRRVRRQEVEGGRQRRSLGAVPWPVDEERLIAEVTKVAVEPVGMESSDRAAVFICGQMGEHNQLKSGLIFQYPRKTKHGSLRWLGTDESLDGW